MLMIDYKKFLDKFLSSFNPVNWGQDRNQILFDKTKPDKNEGKYDSHSR
jgi:hypothetical protein